MNVWNINWPFVLDRARRLGKRFATRNFGFTSQHCFIYTSSFSKQHYSLQLKKCFNGSVLIVWRHCQLQSLFMAIKRTSKSISETWIAARRMILASGASIHLNEKLLKHFLNVFHREMKLHFLAFLKILKQLVFCWLFPSAAAKFQLAEKSHFFSFGQKVSLSIVVTWLEDSFRRIYKRFFNSLRI